jgi:hypothetical protein
MPAAALTLSPRTLDAPWIPDPAGLQPDVGALDGGAPCLGLGSCSPGARGPGSSRPSRCWCSDRRSALGRPRGGARTISRGSPQAAACGGGRVPIRRRLPVRPLAAREDLMPAARGTGARGVELARVARRTLDPASPRMAHGPWVSAAATRLGVGRRCLLMLTSGPFLAARAVAPVYRHLFERYERGGWMLRAASPRNFVCWRRSDLIAESGFPVAVFPDAGFGLSGEEKAALCLLELLRRLARIGLLARPPVAAGRRARRGGHAAGNGRPPLGRHVLPGARPSTRRRAGAEDRPSRRAGVVSTLSGSGAMAAPNPSRVRRRRHAAGQGRSPLRWRVRRRQGSVAV